MAQKYGVVLKDNQGKGKSSGKKLFAWMIALVFVFTIVFLIIDNNIPLYYYLTDMQVREASIGEKSSDNEDSGTLKYYVRVSIPYNSDPSIHVDPDETWIEVTSEYYSKHNTGDKIGILFDNYDVMKPKYWGMKGKGNQKFKKNVWQIGEIYDTLSDAQEANPHKDFIAKAALKKKGIAKDGTTYFVLDIDGKTLTKKVDRLVYDKYTQGQEVEADFESTGPYIKCLNIRG